MKKKRAIEIHTLKWSLDESRNWKRELDGLAGDGAKMRSKDKKTENIEINRYVKERKNENNQNIIFFRWLLSVFSFLSPDTPVNIYRSCSSLELGSRTRIGKYLVFAVKNITSIFFDKQKKEDRSQVEERSIRLFTECLRNLSKGRTRTRTCDDHLVR